MNRILAGLGALVLVSLLSTACASGSVESSTTEATSPTQVLPGLMLPCLDGDDSVIGLDDVDVGNGMDRIEAVPESGVFFPCDGSANTYMGDWWMPGPDDPTLVTTLLDGLYVDAQHLSGTDLTLEWHSTEPGGYRSEAPIIMTESSPGRWDLAELPPPGDYLLQISFRWDQEVGGTIGYNAKVRIPDPLG